MNESAYRLIRQMLDTNEVAYYTHQLKSERPYRVVIRGLHPQMIKVKLKLLSRSIIMRFVK